MTNQNKKCIKFCHFVVLFSEFKPNLGALQSLVNEIAKQLITTIQVIPRIENTLQRHPFEHQRSTFYSIISNDEDILKILVMIMQGVMAITGNLQDLIKPWDSQYNIFSIYLFIQNLPTTMGTRQRSLYQALCCHEAKYLSTRHYSL